MDQASKTERKRNRVEKRRAYTTTDICWLNGKDKLSNIACIGSINTKVETAEGITNEWHHYISSKPLSAEELLKHARLEWSVETMHRLLDVHCREDYFRVAEQRTQENLNIIRKIVLNCIKTYNNKK